MTSTKRQKFYLFCIDTRTCSSDIWSDVSARVTFGTLEKRARFSALIASLKKHLHASLDDQFCQLEKISQPPAEQRGT